MNARASIAGALLSAAVLLPTAASAREIFLRWTPTTQVGDLPSVFSPERWTHDHSQDPVPAEVLDGLRFQVLPFVDRRQEKEVGANHELSWTRRFTTQDDVTAFVTQHFAEVLGQAHLDVVDKGGSRLLKGELLTFFVDEGNTYQGTVRLRLTLTGAQGNVLWTGIALGRSKRFGHSMSEENYNETFSDSIVDAAADLLKNRGFLRAAGGK
ncbi:MAG: hypothetical protein ACYDCL_15005 [Myxococcales bacterium]